MAPGCNVGSFPLHPGPSHESGQQEGGSLRVLAPTDGDGLLPRILEKWKEKAAIVKALCRKALIRRTKATPGTKDLLYAIEGIERNNPGWANALRILALFGPGRCARWSWWLWEWLGG